jgi:hypothetical protein
MARLVSAYLTLYVALAGSSVQVDQTTWSVPPMVIATLQRLEVTAARRRAWFRVRRDENGEPG